MTTLVHGRTKGAGAVDLDILLAVEYERVRHIRILSGYSVYIFFILMKGGRLLPATFHIKKCYGTFTHPYSNFAFLFHVRPVRRNVVAAFDSELIHGHVCRFLCPFTRALILDSGLYIVGSFRFFVDMHNLTVLPG